MELTLINETDEKKWNRYRKDFMKILARTQEFVDVNEDACLSVIFVDSQTIHEINREYRHIDRPTDVISFALMDSDDILALEQCELGDIFINIEAVYAQAREYEHTLRREVCFLFTHGVLHLLGYDHMNPEDEEEMFALQEQIIDPLIKKRYVNYEEK